MSKPESDLDRKRIEELVVQLMLPIQANFKRGPTNRDRVYEALNALASCAAIVIQGSDSDQALEWFSEALNIQLKS